MATDKNTKFKATERWGGSLVFEIDGRQVTAGDVIVNYGGPGKGSAKGVVLEPWSLDEYERVLRLDVTQTWLLKRMIGRAWAEDTIVKLNFSYLELQAKITRPTLRKHIGGLIELGYIEQLNETRAGKEVIGEYSVRGLYYALALCIMADPRSRWAQEHGALSLDTIYRHAMQMYQRRNGKFVGFNLDSDTLERLARRKKETLGVELPEEFDARMAEMEIASFETVDIDEPD